LILATGGGKSAVYILVHRLTGKMVVVFEPLISIIQWLS
jgi:superfamily II DNA helicase RecQ